MPCRDPGDEARIEFQKGVLPNTMQIENPWGHEET